MVNVYSNCVQSVVNSVSNEDIGDESAPIVVVGAGQSLMANWGSTSGLFNTDGNRGILDTLNAHNHAYTNKFVNSGDGASCLFRSTAISVYTPPPNGNNFDQNDYWIDDCGYYPAGTAPYNASTNPDGVKSYFRGETTRTPNRGVRYNDMLADLVSASVSASEITDVVWSQGESEASSLGSYNWLSENQYKNGMQKLFDFFIEDFSSLKLIQIRPIERRAQGNNIVGFERIRNAQRTICANNPNISVFGSEAYDLQLYNDVLLGSFTATASQTVFNLTDYPTLSDSLATRILVNNSIDLRQGTDYTRSLGVITLSSGLSNGDTVEVFVNDSVHRSPSANYIEGTRAAFTILKHRGLYNGSSLGSIISSASYDGDTVSLTMTHENGSSYQFADGEKYLGTPITRETPNGGQFSIISPDGDVIYAEKVSISGNSTVEITPERSLLDNRSHSIKVGYGDMLRYDDITKRVDIDSMVIDNAIGNKLPPRTTATASFNGTTTLPATTSLVQQFDTTIKSANTSGTGTFSSNIITGASLIVGNGILVPDNTGTTRSLTARSSLKLNGATMTRGVSSESDVGIPNITWKCQAVQFPSNIIDFAYTVNVAIPTGATSATLTLPIPVNPARSFYFLDDDFSTSTNSSTTANNRAYLSPIGDGTSVTINAPLSVLAGSGTIICSVQVVQLKAAAVKTIQAISIDIPYSSTSATQTVTATTLANTAFFGGGCVQNASTSGVDSSPARNLLRIAPTSSTVWTATRNTAISTSGFRITGTLVELNSGYWTVQNYSTTTISGTNASTAQAITSVAENKTFILRNGKTTTSTTSANEGEYNCYLSPTVTSGNITALTLYRGSTAANTVTQNYQVITLP